jgi:hypothetical protein
MPRKYSTLTALVHSLLCLTYNIIQEVSLSAIVMAVVALHLCVSVVRSFLRYTQVSFFFPCMHLLPVELRVQCFYMHTSTTA